MATKNQNRTSANADQETRERTQREGGKSSQGGFKNMDEQKQRDIARKGGESSRGGRGRS